MSVVLAGVRTLRGLRRAIVGTCLGVAACIGHAGGGAQSAMREVEAGFASPPAETRPQALWFWMNGNVSLDGITRDLEAMKRVGLSGAIVFDGGTYQPPGPVGYLQREWREAMAHAVREADRLGLRFGMHTGPGWSSSGGPWITPELSMKQLVWSEVTAAGSSVFDAALPQPHTNMGFYRDAVVVAFPTLRGEETRFADRVVAVKSAGAAVDKSWLCDDNLSTGVHVGPRGGLVIELGGEMEVRAVTIHATPDGVFPDMELQVADEGGAFHAVCAITKSGGLGIRAPGVASFAPVRGRVFRILPRSEGDLSEVVLHGADRIEDWVYKANFAMRAGAQERLSSPLPNEVAIDPATVINLTSQLDVHGWLHWEVPPGTWTVLRLGYTTTGMLNTSASAAGTGLECDKLGREGAEAHFQSVQARLFREFGPLVGKSFTTVTIDSYEAGMQNWTASFPSEFRHRMGYDPTAYLPAMTGRVVGDRAVSDRFLFDVRTVQAAMMADNYYARMAELCHENGLECLIEGYVGTVFDEMKVSGLSDAPMGEFWTRTPWAPNRSMKMIASAAHTYGKPIVAAEAFTGEEYTSRWLDYPYALKALGDDMFALGLNQMIFHRFAHQPHPDAFPGMAMGPWGFHYDRTNTWFDQSGGWVDYLARAQYLLRQGHYVADVLCFVGERPPNVAQMTMPLMPTGFDYDLVDAEVLLNRVRVEDGCFVLPEGGRYRVLMLHPDMRVITPELMRRLASFVREGGVVMGPKPEFSPTLRGYPDSEGEVRQLADALWEKGATGKGRVFVDASLDAVLREIGAEPDFKYVGRRSDAALSWTHRRLADGDVYFVGNRQRRVDEVVCSFRVTGRQPEIWNAETGEIAPAVVWEEKDGRTLVPLRLDPAQSLFVVFRQASTSRGRTWVAKDGARILDLDAAAATPSDVAGSFTMAGWVKPDIDLRIMPEESTSGRIDEVGKGYFIPADEGDRRFGKGHATAGVAVGRNGVFVIERSSTGIPAVLVARMPVAGWTHVAVVYREGAPSLYVNGRFVRQGLVSGSVVHAGIGAPPPPPDTVFNFPALTRVLAASGLPPAPSQGRVFYFDGNLTDPELFERALTAGEIAALAGRGIPAAWAPGPVEFLGRKGEAVEARVWKSGRYELGSGEVASVRVADPIEVLGGWRVAFQENRGAPASIEMPGLVSLHECDDPGVRLFSGTATYEHTVVVPRDWLESGKAVVLDLGRVEVVADVRVNGREVGSLWKEPYRIDITAAVRPGRNTLEIRVANLLANRLIGDEQLPAENAYSAGPEHGILSMPDWYMQGKPKPPGGRLTFTTWKFYEKDEPLLASGLLGPVRLLNPVRVVFGQ